MLRCGASVRDVAMMTLADWWRRGDNDCVDGGDDECFTMMLMIITIVISFLLPSVSVGGTPSGEAASACRSSSSSASFALEF